MISAREFITVWKFKSVDGKQQVLSIQSMQDDDYLYQHEYQQIIYRGKSTMINAREFQEAIRHILCMGSKDFSTVFGVDMGSHLFKKFHVDFAGNVADFICYLDSHNIELLTLELNRHNKKYLKKE